MTHPATPPAAGFRIGPGNPNHHLWNNNGTWFIHYTVHPTPHTTERVRQSLGTDNLTLARRKRDRLLVHIREQGGRPPLPQG